MEKLMISRRRFSSLAVLAAVSAWFGSTAASCGSIYAQIAAYVGVGIQAFQSVVNLLSGAGIIALPEGTLISAILVLVKTGWADVQAAIAAYNAAPAASKATLAGKISVALTAVQQEIQQFWSDVKIPDASLANTVAGLLGLIVSTIAGFLASLPVVPATAAAKPYAKTLSITPMKLSVSQFRTKFNMILSAGGHDQYAI
jgi:hypothetical protein